MPYAIWSSKRGLFLGGDLTHAYWAGSKDHRHTAGVESIPVFAHKLAAELFINNSFVLLPSPGGIDRNTLAPRYINSPGRNGRAARIECVNSGLGGWRNDGERTWYECCQVAWSDVESCFVSGWKDTMEAVPKLTNPELDSNGLEVVDPVVSNLMPTQFLRWVKKKAGPQGIKRRLVLYQQWTLTRTRGGVLIDSQSVWREVETVNEEDLK